MNILKVIPTLMLVLIPQLVIADFAGIYLGGGGWLKSAGGTVAYTNADYANLASDLKLNLSIDTYYYLTIEHPVPLIPNYRYFHTDNKNSGSGSISSTYNFGGVAFETGSSVSTSLDISSTSHILYYELLDNYVSFDVGLAFIQMDGKFSAQETGNGNNSVNFPINTLIPSAYVSAGVTIPYINMSLVYEQTLLKLGSSEISDVAYKFTFEDGLIGYESAIRTQTVKLDVSSIKSEMVFGGMYVGMYIHF